MTRKLIAVATALGAAVLLTATAADAAKTPKNYVDNDGNGAWSNGDVDLAPYLKDGVFNSAEVSTTSRGPAADIVIGDASVYDISTTGDLTISGRLDTPSGGTGPVVRAETVAIADKARVKGATVSIHATGAVTIGAQANLTGEDVSVSAPVVLVGEKAKLSSTDKGGAVSITGAAVSVAKGVVMSAPGDKEEQSEVSIKATDADLVLDDVQLSAGYVELTSGPNANRGLLHVKNSVLKGLAYDGSVALHGDPVILEKTKVTFGKSGDLWYEVAPTIIK